MTFSRLGFRAGNAPSGLYKSKPVQSNPLLSSLIPCNCCWFMQLIVVDCCIFDWVIQAAVKSRALKSCGASGVKNELTYKPLGYLLAAAARPSSPSWHVGLIGCSGLVAVMHACRCLCECLFAGLRDACICCWAGASWPPRGTPGQHLSSSCSSWC
jgi:hypothetical protein